ncbi:unnamed protein product (macronuclear) [Paramecium tetraurelia]|uniref:60S acidic ribosomal protein P1 n=1 Tax=Paramecium tetraurelia TaxID=5888 RepID=A0DCV4_PARTE|nr:uncharacterized protein GSPATT00015730001 [Paramecium tetraurelia]CAK80871.1 unnamed protein product [Paramecium tetraurelia]|eukprot:XP_001448268.1 hypothetical protein (macronuclear) [Paramecium tetraurelia strain d4-2]
MARAAKDTRPIADQATSETACTYAALILYEDNQDIDATKLAKIIKASNLRVEPIWTKVFEKALKGKKVGDLLHGSSGSAGSAPQAQTTSTPAAAETKKAEPVKEVKKAEEPEEDVDMGGLFD